MNTEATTATRTPWSAEYGAALLQLSRVSAVLCVSALSRRDEF
jgi:hypothetical protein